MVSRVEKTNGVSSGIFSRVGNGVQSRKKAMVYLIDFLVE